jgi:hypothetical protein
MFTDVTETRAASIFKVEYPILKTEAVRSIEMAVLLQQNTSVTPMKSSNGGLLQISQNKG